ncbi:class I SAM-dependent DNA methyltransferase [Oxobacter pfennigii]|uniref:class I SAM-dependent DNA methyltransferase n=1 Tax=Oxobacter pfennigii TaxID=36849 RepID=UPI0006D40065|nr:class I SAM-dependent methyltransferase [Oxobacter pfennigii]
MQYEDFALIYDMLMSDIDYEGWSSHIHGRIKSNNSEAEKILEMACGTGSISVNMAQLGYNVTAFDLSDEMLSIAYKKALDAGLKIRFLNQDMRSINVEDEFDAVICLCDSINYITNKEDLIQIFKWVYNHLSHTGIFIFDINSSYKLKNIIGNNTFTYNEEDAAYIWENNLTDEKTVEFFITFFIREGILYRRFEEFHTEKIYESNEIQGMLKEAGFASIEMNEAYTYYRAKDDSERISFCCKK